MWYAIFFILSCDTVRCITASPKPSINWRLSRRRICRNQKAHLIQDKDGSLLIKREDTGSIPGTYAGSRPIAGFSAIGDGTMARSQWPGPGQPPLARNIRFLDRELEDAGGLDQDNDIYRLMPGARNGVNDL